MASLSTTTTANHRACMADFRRMAYISTGWNKLRRWNGRTAAVETAGITGPDPNYGAWRPFVVATSYVNTLVAPVEGGRILRYRYMDSRTGYVSNPSNEVQAYISADGSPWVGEVAPLLIGAVGNTVGPHATGMAITATTITRDDVGGSWITDGFAVGDYFTVASAENAGNNGTRGPLSAVTATVLTIAPTLADSRNKADFSVVNADDTTVTITRAAMGRIQPSTDAKVDTIIVESTVVGGGDQFFKIAECANTATSVSLAITDDAELERKVLPWPDEGHEPPPVTKNVVSYRERLWMFGQVEHTTGNANVTNASANVGVGASAPDWNNEALGSALGQNYSGFMFQRTGDAAEYEISHYSSGGSQIVLKKVYAGVTGSDVAYRIFSRANVIWISNPGYPEGFYPLQFLNGPNGEGSGEITAGIGFSGSMIFFSATGMFRFSWDLDPATDGFLTPLSDKAGALSQRVVIQVEGKVFTMDNRGWHVWDGGFPQLISKPLGALASSIDFSLFENFHANYLPETRAVRWFVCYTGETYPKHYVQFDLDTGAWSTGSMLQGMTESRLVRKSAAGLKPFLLDENGHSWWGDTGLADGVPAAKSHITAAAASSTTVVQVTGGGLATTNGGYAGAYLSRRTATGVTESRLISSNTATAITVSSAFSGAPATNDALWIGVIPSLLLTRAFRPKRSAAKIQANELTITFEPTASVRYLQVRVYEDLSATAKTWSVARGNLPGLVKPGVNTAYPAAAWLVDLSTTNGVVTVPIGMEWKRCFEIELSIEEPDADFQLLSLEIPGIELDEVDKT